ncbi:MAG: serine hydrolase domain-containing protein [Steroidobacteraceae bacterium]
MSARRSSLAGLLLAASLALADTPGSDFAELDATLQQSIEAGAAPGAVVLVGQGEQVLYRQAYGWRSLSEPVEPMTVDTVFDFASLTKVVATATALMVLVDEDRLALDDPLSRWLPDWAATDKANLTVLQLATHVAGFAPDVDLEAPWIGRETAMRLALETPLAAPPGERFIYSDIGYFVLAEVIERAAGMPFEEFVSARVLKPLGMRDSGFRPAPGQRERIAPTEAGIERGVVHDPTARRMGGVAGHAGLFSTVDDLTRYVRMILAGGTLDGVRILSPQAVALMTSTMTPVEMRERRGIGWDIDTAFSTPRGERFPVGSVGHTGFTGTSMWLDPGSGAYVLLLTSRLHPDGKGDVRALRKRVATLAARAVLDHGVGQASGDGGGSAKVAPGNTP